MGTSTPSLALTNPHKSLYTEGVNNLLDQEAPMTVEEKIKLLLGDLIIRQMTDGSKIEELEAEIASLKAKPSKKSPSSTEGSAE